MPSGKTGEEFPEDRIRLPWACRRRLNWQIIFNGSGTGVGGVLIDELLNREKKLRLSPVASTFSSHLPIAATLLIVICWLSNRRAEGTAHPLFTKRMGLLATGLIVGEGLFGIVLAGIHFAHVGPPRAVFGEDFAPFVADSGASLFAIFFHRAARLAGLKKVSWRWW